MKQVVVSVFDSAAGCFGRPVFTVSIGAAMRSFSDEVKKDNPDNPMFAHPEDFTLFRLGYWDDFNGAFDMEVRPDSVLRALDV